MQRLSYAYSTFYVTKFKLFKVKLSIQLNANMTLKNKNKELLYLLC